MSFDEVRFPVEIAFESSGGPTRQTQIVILGSGAEARNARWANSRREYDVGYGLRSMNDIHALIKFWEARNGQLIGFRFKDWSDYKSCGPDDTPDFQDQLLGIGDGVTTSFQLTKLYDNSPSSWTRDIKKPVAGTVLIGDNGSQLIVGWSVDYTTGVVTFGSPPTSGHVLTSGFEFDTPVRFNSDKLVINLAEWNAGKVQSCPLKELLL